MRGDARRGDKIGKLSERIVFLALQRLRGENKINGFVQVNEPGVDFVVTLLSKREQPLEVESSYNGRMLHELRYGKTAAPVVIVPNFHGRMPEGQERRLAIRIKDRVLNALLQIKEETND